MIKSKNDYLHYLRQDKKALGISNFSLKGQLVSILFPDPIWKFQKKLRKLEYFSNCKKNKILFHIYWFSFKKYSLRLGFSIPLNVFGPGLAIAHYGTIVINGNTRIGKNCRIHASTNIGASGGDSKAPQIGDNVYIGPGAIIYGDIKIGNNIAIGANSTVNKSFEDNNILVAGSPAKKIKEIDITKIIKHLK